MLQGDNGYSYSCRGRTLLWFLQGRTYSETFIGAYRLITQVDKHVHGGATAAGGLALAADQAQVGKHGASNSCQDFLVNLKGMSF